jgi:XrtJ-associated TM-motif-TM protein
VLCFSSIILSPPDGNFGDCIPGGKAAVMTKFWFRVAYVGLFFLAALPLYAQGGCVDSPESPTAILALIGVAGVFYVSAKRK